MANKIPGHPWLSAWIWAGAFSLCFVGFVALGVFRGLGLDQTSPDSPIVIVGAIAIFVLAVFLYTLPTLFACVGNGAGKHPNRVAIVFINLFLGWTILGWLIAMIWSLTGFSARASAARAAQVTRITDVATPSQSWFSKDQRIKQDSITEPTPKSSTGGADEIAECWQVLTERDQTRPGEQGTKPTPKAVAAEKPNRGLGYLIVFLVIMAVALLVVYVPTDRWRAPGGTTSEPSFVPNATARGVSVVPGALVCPNHDTVSLVFSLYTAQWESAMQDAMTNGQSSLIHGQPSPAPDLEAYGCTLLSPGTPMMLEGGNIVPVVTAKLSNGTIVKGVTLAGMVAQQQYHGAGSMSPQSQPADAPNPQLDAGLANSLSEELQHTLNAAKINVTAENGHVTLAGTVDTTADREEAARIAEARPNVRILTNSLIVQAAARPTADIPAPIVDNSHENTADRADAKTSKLVPVENPNPSTQPLSIPEIDRQAIALWSQKRYSEAIPLFNQACSGGNAGSCYHLGLMYDFGQGVAQDFPRAATFYSKSCNAGNGAACYNLSMLQQYQPGGAVCNSVAVTRNLSRSCDTGIATSCSIVGYSYIHGCGVAKDTEKGRQLLSKGCSLGDHNACDGIK